jgi:hypothetical protein
VKLVRVLALIFLVLTPAKSWGETPFLGPIPVQYAAADKDVILDMHQFFNPAGW